MPPANDNFASPTVLTVPSGLLGPESNVGATAEAGEPGNHGKTVWYSFTPTAAGYYVFDTTSFGYAAGSSYLRTVLQVFVDDPGHTDLAHLTELAYVAPSYRTAYAGTDTGSRVVVAMSAGTTYMIRVDGVAGAEGNFNLAWGQYFQTFLGGCDQCDNVQLLGAQCRGVVQATDIQGTDSSGFSTRTFDFGYGAEGPYVVQYCKGAFNVAPEAGAHFIVISDGLGGVFNPHFFVTYDSGTGADTGSTGFAPDPNGTYPDQASAEVGNACTQASFYHFGTGTIKLQYRDSTHDPNTDGTPNPVFGLFSCGMQFTMTLVGTCLNPVSHSAFQVVITLTNPTDCNWDKISVKLNTTANITSLSKNEDGTGGDTYTNVTFTKRSTQAFTFYFNSTALPVDEFNVSVLVTEHSGGTQTLLGALAPLLALTTHDQDGTVSASFPGISLSGTQHRCICTLDAITAIVTPGVAHTMGQVEPLLGGTGTHATITIDTVNGSGGIISASVNTIGAYTAIPSNPVTVTGSGSVNVTWTGIPGGCNTSGQLKIWNYGNMNAGPDATITAVSSSVAFLDNPDGFGNGSLCITQGSVVFGGPGQSIIGGTGGAAGGTWVFYCDPSAARGTNITLTFADTVFNLPSLLLAVTIPAATC
jgi:hypothetical protein